jgi:hypothetical protein
MDEKTTRAAIEGRRLMQQLDQTIIALGAHNFPRLRIAAITDDGEHYMGLRCPHCQVDVNSGEHLVSVDVAFRGTISETMSDDELIDAVPVHFEYESGAEFNGLHYRCDSCNNGVRLPEGWTEL